MKKFIYLAILLLLGVTIFSTSCKDDKEDEPVIPPEDTLTTPPPAPTVADSLQGTWYSFAAKVEGTIPSPGASYDLSTSDFLILTYDTLKFSNSDLTHSWTRPSSASNWNNKYLYGDFSIANTIMTHTVDSQRVWNGFILSYDADGTVSYNHTFEVSFATTDSVAPYTKDTLTLIMTGTTEITNNNYEPLLSLHADASASNAPLVTIKFARVE